MSTGAPLLSFTVVRNAATTGIYSCCCIPLTFGKPAEAYQGWEVGKCQELDVLLSLGCCSGQSPHMGCWKQGGLGTDPSGAAPRQECQEEASPKPTCTGSAPSQHILGPGESQASRYLAVTCTVFFLSPIFFLKTTCANKLVLEGRVLSLGSFWLEIYFSVHVLCSCTWQSGVCSAVHSPANLVS